MSSGCPWQQGTFFETGIEDESYNQRNRDNSEDCSRFPKIQYMSWCLQLCHDPMTNHRITGYTSVTRDVSVQSMFDSHFRLLVQLRIPCQSNSALCGNIHERGGKL